MKTVYIDQISERQIVESTFLVRDKITAMAKNGKPYMTLKLMDRSGEVEGRIWDRVDQLAERFVRDDFVKLYAKASVYMGKMQLVIQDIDKAAESEVDLADFLPVSKRPPEEMKNELQGLVDSIADEHILALLKAFFDDPVFYTRYCKAPAAKGMHHVYLGGLLEHSLAVAALADDVAARYTQLNRDLLICAALLHDIGKTVELSYERSFDYSDDGKLLGHIYMGTEMIGERIRKLPAFPDQLATMLKHMLLSHHGQYEYGSPKRPKFLEAVVLSFVDDLDAKINGVMSHIEKGPDLEGNWTSYHRLYDRYFYKAQLGAQAEQKPVISAATPAAENKPRSVQKSGGQKRKDFNKPLGATLAEQLKDKNLDLFSSLNDKGES